MASLADMLSALMQGQQGVGARGLMQPVSDPYQSKEPGMGLTEGARLYEGGANPIRAYHGTQRDYGTSEDFAKFRIPYHDEPGVFFSTDPTTASMYAGATEHPTGFLGKGPLKLTPPRGGSVYPVDITPSNSAVVDFKEIAGQPMMYKSRYVQTAIDAAKKANKDFVIMRNMVDVGGTHDQIIAIKPAGKVKSALTGETMLGLVGALMGLSPKKNGDNSVNGR